MADRERERVQGLRCIPDDYTLKGVVQDAGKTRPPLYIWFRPALPEEVSDYQAAIARAINGPERVAAQATFLNAHVVKWAGLFKVTRDAAGNIQEEPLEFNPNPKDWKKSALGDSSVRRGLGVEYMNEISNFVCGYTAAEWDEDAKN